MRKAVLLVLLGVMGITGVAYAATAVKNSYVVVATIGPVKSGTKAHPVPTGTVLTYTTKTVPKDMRPNVIKTIQVGIAGVRANNKAFPTCSPAMLATGPSACPSGSKVGTGYFIAEIGPSADQSKVALTCRVDLTVYNDGAGAVTYYLYQGTAANECTTKPTVFSASLRERGGALIETIPIPNSVRHPVAGLDAAAIKDVVAMPVKRTKVHGKQVGLLESISCPANHKRAVAVKFTLENGDTQGGAFGVPCR